ncbi:flagellar hook-length control protein FliK [Ruegeria marisrubri]|nr:flagellar hook-length control protein FliK [Ruegeria marisrubri]
MDAAAGFARHSRANDPSFTINETGVELDKGKKTPPEAASGEPRGFSVGQQGPWPAPPPRDTPIRPIHAAMEPRALRLHTEPGAALDPPGIGAEFSAAQDAEAPVGLPVTHTPDRVHPQTPAATYSETIRSVARQMSAAIAVRPENGGADIALNPVELGRVSMALRAGEDAVLLSIATERPETLELMKRHIADLTAEFQELGYSDISFEFQSMADGAGGHSGYADHLPAGDMMDSAEPTSDIRTSKSSPSTGIDMRL